MIKNYRGNFSWIFTSNETNPEQHLQMSLLCSYNFFLLQYIKFFRNLHYQSLRYLKENLLVSYLKTRPAISPPSRSQLQVKDFGFPVACKGYKGGVIAVIIVVIFSIYIIYIFLFFFNYLANQHNSITFSHLKK